MRSTCLPQRPLAAMLAAVTCAASIAAADTASPVDFRFRLVTSPERQVRIRAAYAGSPTGETTLEVEREWGGVTAGGEDITDVRVEGAGGRSLEVEHPEPHRWRVRHPPDEPLVVEYAIAANDHRRAASPETFRRPLLDATVLHGYGHLMLLHPAHLDGSARRSVRIAWEGFESAGWRSVCSFGIGAGADTLHASLDQLCSAVYMAGDLDLREREVHGRPVWTAVAGREWPFTADTLATMVQRIVAIEREFFQDFDQPFYLVTLIPVGEVGTGGRSMGGTGLTQSFSLAMLADTELGRSLGKEMGIGGLLAHEMFHEWLGHTIIPEDPEELVYWCTEGWTDFYMRRLLLRGGLIEREEYATSVNAKLAGLFASRVRNAPNDSIRTGFWKNEDLGRLPYLRGDVVAMIADAAIRRASRDSLSLDDVVRDLVHEARTTGRRYDTEEILRRIAARSDERTADKLRAIVVAGATPELDADLFAPCLEMRTETLRGFDLGFDFAATRATKTVRGVRPESNAAVAGLRDGQKVRGWSVRYGDPTEPVRITIEESGKERPITYLPAGEPIPTPQFSVARDSRDCGKL